MSKCNSRLDLLFPSLWIVVIISVIENSVLLQVNCQDQVDSHQLQSRIKRKAIPNDSQRWPGGIIPYFITDPLAKDFVSREAISESIQTLETDTCIQFKDVDGYNLAEVGKHVQFIKATGCHSSVGNTNSKDFQVVSIGQSCGYPQMVLHELGHLVGLIHEHCRPDRDAHIKVNWSNIYPDMAYNFDKVQDVRLFTPYDLSSFMHYGLKIFSNNKRYNSIIPINDDLSFLVGYRHDLSFYDKVTINTLYQCAAHCPYYSPVCENEGFLDKHCRCICPRLLTGDRCQHVLTDQECGGVVYVTDQTEVTTPNYPHHYRNRQSCVWFLKTAPDLVLQLEFEDFDLETGRYGVCRDQLEIRAHYIGLDRGRAYCGQQLNDTIVSTSNKLILNFKSSQSTTRRGFKAKIRTLPKTDCSSSPCQNDGICQEMENYPDYYCQCPEHWIGKNCDIPVSDGAFSEWGDWSPCTAECGLQCRHRECDSPPPQNGGRECTGVTIETRRCQSKYVNCSEQFICEFEQGQMCYGMWITGHKHMAWRTNIGATQSMHTGPSQGHLGLTDGYIFMESSHGQPTEETVLWLPSNRWKQGMYCLQFYYHLYGMTSGSIRVLRRSINSPEHILWQKSNDRGNQWIEANLNVFLNKDIELGVVGIKGMGYYSDIALDDISLSPGSCQLPRGTYARGCSDGAERHAVGPFTSNKDCKKQNCFCNPDGEIDCPSWDWEVSCAGGKRGDNPSRRISRRKKYRYKPKFPLRRNNRNNDDSSGKSSGGSIVNNNINIFDRTNQLSPSANQVNQKQSGHKPVVKHRPRNIIKVVSSKKNKPSLRLIGSGDEY